jgi:hypothetical protein
MPHMGEKIPRTYLQLERWVARERKRRSAPVLGLAEMESLYLQIKVPPYRICATFLSPSTSCVLHVKGVCLQTFR